MPVLVRDAVASDHLVYAWPFPIGPEEHEVACSDDEQVVMCPAWTVGDRLGPGRHRWRTPDPTRPVSAFFVLTAPVEVSFDMLTGFTIPTTGQPVRLRATGSLQVRCGDPGLLIAQFVGLPFDHVNDGILRSVSRSVERMLARLLTRRVVMAGTPAAVTDPSMLAGIVEELIAYNPAAGAVFGIELIRMGHLSIFADDGTQAFVPPRVGPNGDTARGLQTSRPDIPLLETVRAVPSSRADIPLLETVRSVRAQSHPGIAPPPPPAPMPPHPTPPMPMIAPAPPPGVAKRGNPVSAVSGEIGGKPTPRSRPASDPPPPARVITTPVPAQRQASSHDVPLQTDDITEPDMKPARGAARAGSEPPTPPEARGAIVGIGMSHIGSSHVASGVASGEITKKMPPGARVLVVGPNGLMQSATVRQLLQGYYELEVGSSGETIWVPINGVVPE